MNNTTFNKTNPKANGFITLLQNPSCDRLMFSTVIGYPIEELMKEKGHPPRPISAIAISSGVKFEKSLNKDSGKLLIECLQSKGCLLQHETEYINVETELSKRGLKSDDKVKNLVHRFEITKEYLKKKRLGLAVPNVLSKAVVSFELHNEHWFLEVDELIQSKQDAFYSVVEVKSFADRDSKTDKIKIQKACLQMGLYNKALQQYLARHNPAILLKQLGYLIMTKANSNKPSIREIDLKDELNLISDVQSQISERYHVVLEQIGHQYKLSDALLKLSTHRTKNCSQCPMYNYCRQEAESLELLSQITHDPKFLELQLSLTHLEAANQNDHFVEEVPADLLSTITNTLTQLEIK